MQKCTAEEEKQKQHSHYKYTSEIEHLATCEKIQHAVENNKPQIIRK
jgi:hypothetical protein